MLGIVILPEETPIPSVKKSREVTQAITEEYRAPLTAAIVANNRKPKEIKILREIGICRCSKLLSPILDTYSKDHITFWLGSIGSAYGRLECFSRCRRTNLFQTLPFWIVGFVAIRHLVRKCICREHWLSRGV